MLRPRKELPSTLSVLPLNCLQSPSHFLLRNVGSDSHVINFDSDKRFGVVSTCHWLIPEARGRRSGSVASRLLGLQARFQPGAWMSVSCECCVLSSRGLWDGLITRPESYPLLCVWVIVKPPERGGLGPVGAVTPWNMPVGGPGADEPERRHLTGSYTPCFWNMQPQWELQELLAWLVDMLYT